MMKRTKTITVAGVAALALVGVGTGVAVAQPEPTPTPSGSPAPHGARHGHGGFDGFGRFGGFGGQIEHGEATVDTGNNVTQVVDIQRGTVQSVGSGTLTVQSADGFSATYTADSTTTIRKNRQASDISQVVTSDQVTVEAINANGTDTAKHINDTGPAASPTP